MRNAVKIMSVFLLLAYLVLAIGFVSDRRTETICSGIIIDIPQVEKNHFLDKGDIEKILENNGVKVKGRTVKDINTRKIEELFRKNAFIRKAETFITVDGALTIKIRQRIPVLRVISSSGNTWYMDSEGFAMPASRKYTPHILVANGDFNMGNQLTASMSLGKVSDTKFYKPWKDALALALYINEDDFLRAQILQIYLNSKNEFELIPRIGAHQIILGDASGLEGKFFKLEVFYREGLRNVGWNNYQKIDLRFKNQVVCSKR